jgi:hypothetical protein
MEITKAMIEAYAARYEIDLADGSQEPGIVGSLNMWAEGKGELDAKLVNGNPLFDELRAAYAKANGYEEPEDWKKPLVDVEEKLPEAGDVNT